ncbi:MAG: FAD-binding oxidoreductase [Phycisphaerales bacterium]|nr:FAD-binding oxidoreductase [Phycisphaerales bacterium]
MKLKSGCIFWPQVYPDPEPQFPRLDRDIQCDVAILGGGISGALAAYHLVRAGIHAVMIERHGIGHGSTAASTGLLQYEIDTPLVELARKIGTDRAVQAYRASLESLLAFEPLVDELGDSCGLRARPSLYLASEERDIESLRAECEARRSMGIDVEFLGGEKLRDEFGFQRPAALRSRRAFEVDPFKLTLQLVRCSVKRGLEVFVDTRVTGYSGRDHGLTLDIAGGPKVTARKVVFATGYEAMRMLPPGLCRLASTYALVSEPVASFSGWPQRCLIWESARPYLYMRTTEDGRAIVGGEDVDTADVHQRDALLETKAQVLGERFSKLMPEIPIEAACAWAGTFAQTKDGLPYIGALPQFPHSYFALGYGGNGITFSLLAAEIIRDLFLGKVTERTHLFDFAR